MVFNVTIQPRAPWLAALAAAAAGAVFAAVALAAQSPTGAAQGSAGTLEQIVVHGRSLEGNLEGDSPYRDVFVYLPPSYARDTSRRYPVIYFLHGYTVGANTYVRMTGLPETADAVMGRPGAREAIIVLPDAYTIYGGSMYSNSLTTGDWETFVAEDLVGHIDRQYRTLPTRESRGLSGHSMGGYGTMRIGMKRPDVFSSLYNMSACCLMNNPAQGRGAGAGPARGAGVGTAAGGRGTADGRGAAAGGRGGGMSNALFAQAAAWAPNPQNPPQYFDLPEKDGEIQPLIAAKWVANSPLVMVDQYVPSLKRYRAIAMDVGDEDGLAASNRDLDESLMRLGIDHTFEVYEGNHTNRVRERFERHVLPFFAEQLRP